MDGELDAIRERLLSDVLKRSETPEGDEETTQAKEALVVIIKHILRSTDQDKMAEWFSGWNRMNRCGCFHRLISTTIDRTHLNKVFSGLVR